MRLRTARFILLLTLAVPSLLAAERLAAQPSGIGPQTVTFTYTGAAQFWTVPLGVTTATFDVSGAAGGVSGPNGAENPFLGSGGGLGGRATATIPVVPGTVLQITVGGAGGTIRDYSPYGGGGGGASDVRLPPYTLADRIIVAGGGGGGGSGTYSCCAYSDGGAGGGTTGGAGSGPGSGATGGTQSAGGMGARGDQIGANGTIGQGGNAAATGGGGAGGFNGGGQGGGNDVAVGSGGYYGNGGGGGGGYYGGGGGAGQASSSQTFGGGGGSGFGPAGTQFKSGVQPGNGVVAISFTGEPFPPAVALTANAAPGSSGWYKAAPVLLTVRATDPPPDTSTIASITCNVGTLGPITGLTTQSATAQLSISTEGTSYVTCTATDSWANPGSNKPRTVKLDTVPPVITHSQAVLSCSLPGTNGWCRGVRTAAFRALDIGSGLANPQQEDISVHSGTNGVAVQIASGQVCDVVGHCNPGITAGPFKIDSVPPGISVQSVTSNGQPYTPGQTATAPVTVVFACTDALSGSVSPTVSATVSKLGNGQTASGTCTDLAGNTSHASVANINIGSPTPTPTPSSTPAPTPTPKG